MTDLPQQWLPPYDGIVLAGGRGRRMGGARKPELLVGGRRLLDVALEALGAAEGRVVVGGAGALPPGVMRVTEEPPGGGPVAALAAGLGHVSAPVCVVLAGDLPFVAGRHVGTLVGSLGSGAACLALDDGGRDQVLLAAYATAALRAALPVPVQGASMRALLARLAELGEVHRVPLAGEPPPWFDCDTVEDLALARGTRRPQG